MSFFNKNMLTERQKKMLLVFCIFMAFVFVPYVIYKFNSFEKDKKIAEIKNEVRICRDWGKNINTQRNYCAAYSGKLVLPGNYSAYKDKEKKCWAEFDTLKAKFIDRTMGNYSINKLYIAGIILSEPGDTKDMFSDMKTLLEKYYEKYKSADGKDLQPENADSQKQKSELLSDIRTVLEKHYGNKKTIETETERVRKFLDETSEEGKNYLRQLHGCQQKNLIISRD